ncbi:tetratricopeptide repeat protein [Oceanicola sp. 502str15]|uniref:tetratricopeptide repeat protein n=1 Tax=Oceanicola sp. 502str15 TaxID=2696061 RepID=UPI002095B8E4|nr:tetratricopeptide repeat protein [Oceanicola sp. 502str15]MCO6382084.1 hypothetical protein [Oceanicola sp. 502str15]
MSAGRVLACAAAALIALALLLGGRAPFGRVLLAAGLPAAAVPLLGDPGWRGVALYRAGRFDAAAEAFAQAGQPFNRGNALARAGRYAAALEAYDMARAGGDQTAGANFDLVAAFYAGLALEAGSVVEWFEDRDGTDPAVESFEARGNARAAGSGTEVTNVGALIGLPELEGRGARETRKVFDDKFITADERWLETLADVPGDYLAARIRHEHKRRARAGEGQPEPEDAQ